MNVTEPVGPWSNPYLGRTDFDSISLDAVGRRDAPFPAPVEANSYDEQFTTPLTYNYNLTLEREVLAGWMARAAYVGSKATGGRHTISLNPAIYVPGATTGTTDARRALQPYGAIGTYVQDRWSQVQRDAADPQSAVLTRLYDQFELHARERCRQLR